LCDEVPNVRHQNVATERLDQRLLAILAAARTQVAGEPHHVIEPFGERRRVIGHFSFRTLSLRLRRFILGAGGFFGGWADSAV
jgi:hypothetical protein